MRLVLFDCASHACMRLVVQVLTAHDLERTMSNIEATLGNTRKDWETRVVAVSGL